MNTKFFESTLIKLILLLLIILIIIIILPSYIKINNTEHTVLFTNCFQGIFGFVFLLFLLIVGVFLVIAKDLNLLEGLILLSSICIILFFFAPRMTKSQIQSYNWKIKVENEKIIISTLFNQQVIHYKDIIKYDIEIKRINRIRNPIDYQKLSIHIIDKKNNSIILYATIEDTIFSIDLKYTNVETLYLTKEMLFDSYNSFLKKK